MVRCRRTGMRSRTCSTCLQTSAGVEYSLTPKGDLRANQGVMAMSREGASAPYWRYRSGSEKLTMSTSRTARRPTSVAPAIAIAALRFARFGLGRAAFCCSSSDHNLFNKTQPARSTNLNLSSRLTARHTASHHTHNTTTDASVSHTAGRRLTTLPATLRQVGNKDVMTCLLQEQEQVARPSKIVDGRLFGHVVSLPASRAGRATYRSRTPIPSQR